MQPFWDLPSLPSKPNETGAMREALKASLGGRCIPIITSRWLLDFAMEDSETKDMLQQWDIYLANNPDAQSMVVFIPKLGILDPTAKDVSKIDTVMQISLILIVLVKQKL